MKNVFILLFILASCGDSGSSPRDIDEKSGVAEDSVNRVDSLGQKKTPFLDIAFLESLEYVEDDILTARLAKLGFEPAPIEEISYGENIHFVNEELNTSLTLIEINYYEGAREFCVIYILNEPQFRDFEENLLGTSYNIERIGFYKKKGLGSYVTKTVRLTKNPFVIAYVHDVMKEVSAIPTPGDEQHKGPRK